MASVHSQGFETGITVDNLSTNSYTANLNHDWATGDAPHGGYLAAIFYRVARNHFARRHPNHHGSQATPIAMQMAFARRCSVGTAILRVQDVKLGSRISLIQMTLSQPNLAGQEVIRITAYITISNIATEQGLSTRLLQPRGLDPATWCATTPTSAPTNWKQFTVPHPSFRRAASHVQVFRSVRALQPGANVQWARLLRPEDTGKAVAARWSNEAMTFLLDIFPTVLEILEQEVNSTRMVQLPVWFPTLAFNIDFKKLLPPDGVEWLCSHITTRSVLNGRTNIEVVLMDEQGDIVALANQTGLVTDPHTMQKSSTASNRL